MTSITFFLYLIPALAIILLIVNFLFATHSPYQEKNSVFECGFHSFLGQNRMEFNISFYIFGLLFLLFDLEILLIYPYPVSAQFNSIYGLSIMILFSIILALGFTFELGKGALKIESRQYNNDKNIYKSNLLDLSKVKKFSIVDLIIFTIFIILLLLTIFNNPILCQANTEDIVQLTEEYEYWSSQVSEIQTLMREQGLTKSNNLLSPDILSLKQEYASALRDSISNVIDAKNKLIEAENAIKK